MYKYKIFNNIAPEGIDYLVKENLILNEDEPEALLLRSKVLSENNFNDQLLCIGRAGAGVNNIPIDIASKRGVVVFNTPGANANAVKELVLCGLLLSSRGIIQGNSFAKSLAIDEVSAFNSRIENEKKNFYRCIIGSSNISYSAFQQSHELNIEISKKNGNVVASFPVLEGEQLMLATDQGKIIRISVDGGEGNTIRVAGRKTQGVNLFTLSEGEKVVSVDRVKEEEDEEED